MEILNKKNHKNKWVYILIILFLFAVTFFINIYHAKAETTSNLYVPLAPIKANVDIIPASGVGVDNFSLYLNNMFKLGIALAGALAVIQIIIGGMKYVTSATMGQKGDGKAKIEAAIMGLVVVLGAYALLNTIDSRLLRTDALNKYGPVTTNTLNPLDPCPEGTSAMLNSGGMMAASLEFMGEKKPCTKPTPQDNLNSGTGSGQSSGSGTGSGLNARFSGDFEAIANDAVKNSNLSSLKPKDAAKYLPNGGTNEDWVNLLAAMAKKESNFDTRNDTFDPVAGNPNSHSIGLLQLSPGDGPAYGLPTYTTEQLKDPAINLKLGVAIIQKLVNRDGCITCQSGTGKWIGASAYWSTLRTNNANYILK